MGTICFLISNISFHTGADIPFLVKSDRQENRPGETAAAPPFQISFRQFPDPSVSPSARFSSGNRLLVRSLRIPSYTRLTTPGPYSPLGSPLCDSSLPVPDKSAACRLR